MAKLCALLAALATLALVQLEVQPEAKAKAEAKAEAAEAEAVPAKPETAPEEARALVVRAVNAFSADLYKRAGAAAEGNVVLSPLSAGLLLALTWEGAAGATAKELSRALHLPEDRQLVASGSKGLISSLQKKSGQSTPLLDDANAPSPLTAQREVVLRIANRLYAQRGFGLKEDFRTLASDSFGAEAQELDFARDAERARSDINRWVEEYTAGKIKELLPKGSPSPASLLVLVNAVYLKAGWMKPFDKSLTKMTPFHLSRKSSVDVSTMRKLGEFNFAHLPQMNATALELPVEGGRGLKMTVVLPDSVDGLAQLEANLERLDVNAIPWEERRVNISLPKFHIEATHNLVNQLRELGVKDLFNENANLNGIADGGMYVSKALQKTFIDVNEFGIEAAAASGVEFVKLSLPPSAAKFDANHPFLFFVSKEEAILFLGRVTDPRPI